MKTIQLINNAVIELPEDWCEVPAEYRDQIWNMFTGMLLGQMNLFAWQFRTLLLLTEYRPSISTRIRRELNSEDVTVQAIEHNLIVLAEQLVWPFTEDIDGPGIRPFSSINQGKTRYRLRCEMHDAPFACSTRFDRRGPVVETNLTAGQYDTIVSALEIINEEEQEPPVVNYAMQLIADTLGAEDAASPARQLAFTIWATGIVQYFQNHPVYRLLYSSKSKPTAGNIIDEAPARQSLIGGVRETMFELEQAGFRDVEQMPIEKFMDAQIKMLRDNLRKAVAEGVKKEKLAQKTGLSFADLEQLL